MKQTPISDSGIVTTGISTERNEPRKRRMTRTTMTTASAMVVNTSSIEALIDSVESYISVIVMPSGRLAWIAGSSAITADGGVERVGRRRREDADERARHAVEGDDGVVALGAEFDRGDVAEPHDLVADRLERQLRRRPPASAASTASPPNRRRTRSGSCRRPRGSSAELMPASTSAAVSPRAASFTGSIQMRIE